MAESIWVRTESGTVLEMDLPLAEGIGQRLERGEIVRVANAAGDLWQEPDTPDQPPTAKTGQYAAEALAAELVAARERIDELAAELDLAEKQRDALAVALDEARAQLAKPAKATKAKA